MSISKKDVEYIAALSRIHVPEDKLEGVAKNLSDIVGYVEQLQQLNLKDVKPTSHAVPLSNALRLDVVKPSFSNAEALSIAPEAKDGCFKVPLVIE
ncbi:MAG: Asp-tRNA(Asn)/Glu-tRNA(Gln) amidotransferase subunit GatC [Candidatus Omnitrophica bacterium]|nr:Asp-tRNA(Asn)/Glu-tRNA(Gln) amidotransferase subunit GatC [Candidatus Omnitrophota bacterium]